jgi:hypothetical protein
VRTAVLAGLVLVSGSAWAEPSAREGVRLDAMQPATPDSPFFRAEGPHVPEVEGVDVAFGLTLDYATKPLRAYGVDAAGNATELATPVSSLLLAHVGASLTPVHWLTFELSMPFALVESGDLGDKPVRYAGESVQPPAGQGVGDLRVGALVRPIDRKGFSVIAGARFWAPFGSQGAYLSDARPRFEIHVGAAGETNRLLYGCTLALAPGLLGGRVGDRFSPACAAHVRATSALSVGIEPTVSLYAIGDKSGDTHVATLFEPLAAARLRLGGLGIGLAVGPGFGDAPGTGAFRGLLSIAYTGKGRPERGGPSGPRDADVDGIPDADDACPDEAGPESADPTKRGCPSTDRDGDGAKDAVDACPERAGVKNADPKANGCPDVDNDEMPDPIDRCPNEPGTVASGGCPKYARLAKDTFVVSPPLAFKGFEVKLSPEERSALQEIAATMRANPKIEQVSVSLGTKGVPAAVSDKRAQDILLVFQGANLDSSRYEVVLSEDKAGNIAIRLIR